jgi:signal transduction histidine kinase
MSASNITHVLDLFPDAVVQVDAERRIAAVNAMASALTGYPSSELVGRDAQQALKARGRDGHPLWALGWHPSAYLRSVTRLSEQEVTIRAGNGREARIFVAGSYQRHANGELAGAMLVLRGAGRLAHQPSTGIEIVSTVSHELRSPLTSVKGYTSLLLNRWDRLKDDQKQMMLEQVNHDADRVTRLITELLDISRLESGRLVLHCQLVDLPRIAAMVVDKVGLEYEDLEADVSFPPDFPKAYADPDKIEQVLINLVENACKYASPKGLSVVGTVTCGGAGPGDTADELWVTVSDRGDGIPTADLPKVFTKFFRRSEGRPTGSGLGLWISRGLVEAHGGVLTAESIAGQGTTFRFTLPLAGLEDLHRP